MQFWRARLEPFSQWNKVQPTQSLPWYDAYNKVKHDREGNFRLAQLSHALHAVAGVFVLTIAQFGTAHLDQGAAFHIDEFRVEKEPSWPANETHARPVKVLLNFEKESKWEWLGFERWTPQNCQL